MNNTVQEMIATLRHVDSQPNNRAYFVRELDGNRFVWMTDERWGVTVYMTNSIGDVIDQWDGKERDIPARFL